MAPGNITQPKPQQPTCFSKQPGLLLPELEEPKQECWGCPRQEGSGNLREKRRT